MHTFPRPTEKTLSVHREPVGGSCPECAGEALESYRVLSEGGWWDVLKCSACLASVSRVRSRQLGSIVPLSSTL